VTTAVETDYAAFYATHYEGVVRFVTARLDQDAAEDVVAEAFTAVWKRWGELDDPAGYLYGACKNKMKTEYADRHRRPVAVAEVPDQPATAAPAGLAGEAISARLLLKSLDLDTEPKHMALVAAGLADGYDRRRVAEMTGLPLAEVHRLVRQLRKHWRTREAKRLRTAPAGYIPQRLTGQAVRELPRRQRQVMALAALGVRPVAIAALLDIEPGGARVNLHHARQAILAKIEVDVRGAVDAAVATAVDTGELLELLPPSPWREDALVAWERDAALANLARHLNQAPEYLGAADINTRIAASLTKVSVVIAVSRKALRDRMGIAAQCGSVRWRPPTTTLLISGMSGWLAERQIQVLASKWLTVREQQHMDLPLSSRYRNPVPVWPSPRGERRVRWPSSCPDPQVIMVKKDSHYLRAELTPALAAALHDEMRSLGLRTRRMRFFR